MRYRVVLLALVGVIAIAAVVGYLRWPRLSPDMVHVTSCRVSVNELELEYRMRQPFSLKLRHTLREADYSITEAPSGKLDEEVARFSSRYDVLRGEHYVGLLLSKADELHAEGNGQAVTIDLWSARRAADFTWHPSGVGAAFGSGVGFYLAELDSGNSRREYITASAVDQETEAMLRDFDGLSEDQ